jgi:hypothetical protein
VVTETGVIRCHADKVRIDDGCLVFENCKGELIMALSAGSWVMIQNTDCSDEGTFMTSLHDRALGLDRLSEKAIDKEKEEVS